MGSMLDHMVDKQALGAIYRQLRTLAGKTQRDVAAEVGVSYQYISAVELGKENPTLETLEAMAKAVQVSVEIRLGRPSISPIDRLTSLARTLSEKDVARLLEVAELLPKVDEMSKGSALAGLRWAAGPEWAAERKK